MAGNAGFKRVGDVSPAGGALALRVCDTAAGAGDGGDKAGDLGLIGTGMQFSGGTNVQRSRGRSKGQGSEQRRRRAKSRTQRWWKNAS